MTITVHLARPFTVFTDDAAESLIGQTVPLSLDGRPAGDARVVRAYPDPLGGLHAELEVPDAVASRLEGTHL